MVLGVRQRPLTGTSTAHGRDGRRSSTRFLYWPMARPTLPFELAKVEDGDDEAALAFVRKRGLLGFNRMAAPAKQVDGEPLSFIWATAKKVRELLTSIGQLQSPDLDAHIAAWDRK